MARYIDADKLKGWLRLDQAGTKNTVTHQSEGLHPIRIMQLKCFIGDIEYCLSKINEAPTADVAEVVRCKDCKHFMEYSEEYHGKVESADGDCYLRLINSVDKQFQAVCCDDFCSYGERKKVKINVR